MEKKTITTTRAHPLEELLGIAPNSTEVVKSEYTSGELVKTDMYDPKDEELERDFDDVASKALTAYDRLQEAIDDSEPKHLARLSEVAAQTLTVALNALDKKAKIKELKDKLMTKMVTDKNPKTVNQTLVINREDLLKKIKKGELDE